ATKTIATSPTSRKQRIMAPSMTRCWPLAPAATAERGAEDLESGPAQLEIVSPPSRVPIACQVTALMLSLTKRTEPSPISALTPPLCLLRANRAAFGFELVAMRVEGA